MKNRLKMTLVSLILAAACTFTAVMPTFANDDISSRGSLVLEDGDVGFYGEDIEAIDSKVTELSLELSDEVRSYYESDRSEGFRNYVSVNGEAMSEGLKSRGIINYDSGKVVFDASDLFKIADRIENLSAGYKYEVVSALNAINTYNKEDGTITHEQSSGVVLPENASKLKISDICAGILKSQSVDHLADKNINPASEDNLSKGSAAWVDGKLLIGSGADNEESYNKGYEDGYDKGLEDGKTDNSGSTGNMGVTCYYLGPAKTGLLSDKAVYPVAARVPEVDYTQLTTANFIVCPYKIKDEVSTASKYISAASNITTYCKIIGMDIESIEIEYDPTIGSLTVKNPVITAEGGISSLSGFSRSVTAEVEVGVYLVVGEIKDRTVKEDVEKYEF